MHTWKPHATMPYLILDGVANALVRTKPLPCGQYLWQFRKTAGKAATLDKAKDYVEAGAEYFDVMRRNPYAA